jgi:hypothetical protein
MMVVWLETSGVRKKGKSMVINLRVSRDFIKAAANDLANLGDDVIEG